MNTKKDVYYYGIEWVENEEKILNKQPKFGYKETSSLKEARKEKKLHKFAIIYKMMRLRIICK